MQVLREINGILLALHPEDDGYFCHWLGFKMNACPLYGEDGMRWRRGWRKRSKELTY
jgi:hypothetical protein